LKKKKCTESPFRAQVFEKDPGDDSAKQPQKCKIIPARQDKWNSLNTEPTVQLLIDGILW